MVEKSSGKVFAVCAFFSCARVLMRGQIVLARAAYSAQQLQFEYLFSWSAGRNGCLARDLCLKWDFHML